MKVYIKKLDITNFRNIVKASYEFDENKNAISGKNAIGKSNVLEAIHWLLVGKSLNGSSDDTANKPHDDLAKVVEVSATIVNGDVENQITKRYIPSVADGKIVAHSTELTINDIKFATLKDANKAVAEIIKTDNPLLLINPLAVSQVDYKVLRKLIIGIIGDASSEEIYHKAPLIKKVIGDDLTQFKNDIEAYSKHLSDESKKAKKLIEAKNIVLAYLQNDEQAKSTRFGNEVVDKALIDLELAIRLAIETLNAKLSDISEKQTALQRYINMRLDKLNENAKKVFGRVRWNFIDYNLKDYSFNEVCYPFIIGKDTRFDNGSTSEKIITGVEIINALCKSLDLPSLPIIFDEGEALDSESITAKLQTPSQVITAKVNDNYATPTIVKL